MIASLVALFGPSDLVSLFSNLPPNLKPFESQFHLRSGHPVGDRELLLARSHRFVNGVYSALAGFVEPGETIEDCVRREVREEVGVEVDHISYFASQSWAFPHSLMIAYTAEYAGGDMRPSDEEIADAQWFSVDALPALPNSVSIARRLIDATVARLRSSS